MVEADLDRLVGARERKREKFERACVWSRARSGFVGGHFVEALQGEGVGDRSPAAARAKAAKGIGRSILPTRNRCATCSTRSGRRRLSPRRADLRARVASQRRPRPTKSTSWERCALPKPCATYAGGPRPRILFTSSAEVYGRRDADEFPLRETLDLRPATPYAREQSGRRGDSAGHARAFDSTSWSRERSIISDRVRDERFVVPRWPRSWPASLRARRRRCWSEISMRRAIFSTCATSSPHTSRSRRDGERGEDVQRLQRNAVAIRDVLRELIAIARVPVEVREDPQRFRSARDSAVRRRSAKAPRAHRLAARHSVGAFAARRLRRRAAWRGSWRAPCVRARDGRRSQSNDARLRFQESRTLLSLPAALLAASESRARRA